MTPSIPIKSGKIRISGIRNRICLVMESTMPLVALPMEVKKFAVTGCRPFKKVQNIKMRKYFWAN